MSWFEDIDDAGFLRSLFPKAPRGRDGFHVHEVVVSREGPTVRIRLDLPDYPVSPPRKWVEAGYDTVSLTLMAIGVHSLSLEGIDVDMCCSLVIAKSESGITLELKGRTNYICVETEFLRVDEVRGYCNAG